MTVMMSSDLMGALLKFSNAKALGVQATFHKCRLLRFRNAFALPFQ